MAQKDEALLNPTYLPTPFDFSSLKQLPFITSVLSSDTYHWQGFVVGLTQLKPVENLIAGYIAHNSLIIHMSGVVDLMTRFQDKVVIGRSVPGNICNYPAGIETEFSWNAEATNLFLYFQPEVFNELADDVSLGDSSRLILREEFNFRDPLIYQIGLALVAELTQGGLLGQVYAETLGQTMALHLIRQHSSHSLTRPQSGKHLTFRQLRVLDDYIHDHLEHPISLNDLATTVGLSPFHFTRLFKGSTGLAPHQYLIRYRVERARELLEEGRLSVSQIAGRVGFVDQSHLSRHFKKVYRVSPAYLLKDSKNVP